MELGRLFKDAFEMRLVPRDVLQRADFYSPSRSPAELIAQSWEAFVLVSLARDPDAFLLEWLHLAAVALRAVAADGADNEHRVRRRLILVLAAVARRSRAVRRRHEIAHALRRLGFDDEAALADGGRTRARDPLAPLLLPMNCPELVALYVNDEELAERRCVPPTALPCVLSELPLDVVRHVHAFLRPADLFAQRLVCTQLWRVADTNRVWKRFFMARYGWSTYDAHSFGECDFKALCRTREETRRNYIIPKGTTWSLDRSRGPRGRHARSPLSVGTSM